MANVPTVSWDETKPAGSRDISLGDDDIREMKRQIREILAVDHEISSSGQGENWGRHNIVTLLVQTSISALADAGKIYSKDFNGKAELCYLDEDGDEVQLTRGGVLHIPDGAELESDAAPTDDKGIANKKYVDDKVAGVRTLSWYLPYEQVADAVETDSPGARLTIPFAGTITKAIIYAETGPTGAAMIADIHLNGSTIWATQGNRVQVAAGANEGTQETFDTTVVAVGDDFKVFINQVGSTIAGSDVSIHLEITV
jgi:hypothetical protein